ncbi:YddF family protein [Clostridium cochlearium]|uniref:YddF family protein n=1 Tax=Clostridium cochlearium TaxID=1494 RepID=UPI00180DEBA9|nr:YddF family protein [Clostridium cochlearium]NMA58632.1 YddF family protein [Clostridium cochlearium]
MTKLGLLNTSIITEEGIFSLKTISLETAKEIVANNIGNLDSAIGHQSTANIMSILLGVEIPVNRQQFSQKVGQNCLVFKLNGRPEEGKILTIEEIKTIGFKFQLLSRLE